MVRIREEAPALSEGTCMALVRQTIPFASITPLVLPAITAIVEGWRAKGTRINWWTLSYLRELTQRIGSPDPSGWRETPSVSVRPFVSSLDLAIAIESALALSTDFVLERYRYERKYDRTMEQLWIEILIFLCPGRADIIGDVLQIIKEIKDIDIKIAMLEVSDSVLGGKQEFREFLSEMNRDSSSQLAAFVCMCLLVIRQGGGGAFRISDELGGIAILGYCPIGIILRLPNEYFFAVAARIIHVHKELESRTFNIIAEGLRRLFRDSRNTTISSTTMFGYLDVAVQVDCQGGVIRPTLATVLEMEFLRAIYTSSEVWKARTDIWLEYGLELGRASVRELIEEMQGRAILLLQLMVLIAFRGEGGGKGVSATQNPS